MEASRSPRLAALPDRWYQDREVLKEQYRLHGSLAEAARQNGVTQQTLSVWWRKHDLPALSVGSKPKTVEHSAGSEDASVLAALKKLGDHATVLELADAADISPRRVRESLEHLGYDGYRVAEDDQVVSISRVPVPSDREHELLFEGELYRFGIASDVHLNSKHCRLEELHIAYDRFASEGIETVYNAGDIVAGRGIYRGQDHEIRHHTYQDQVDFATENYPRKEGILTRIISGNHDCEGDFGRAGADACQAVANRRDDLSWDGMYAATYYLPQGTRIDMRHPMGGSSYARSYIPQKFAESFEGGDKPNVMIFGHWHNALFVTERNIQMVNAGTFEGGGNSLGLRKPLGAPAVGFWIVEMTVADDGSVVRFQPEWFPFYRGRRAHTD